MNFGSASNQYIQAFISYIPEFYSILQKKQTSNVYRKFTRMIDSKLILKNH